MRIRYTNANDATAIERICVSSFALTVNDVDARFPGTGGEYLYRNYARRVALERPSHCFVAEQNGAVVGFIIFGADADMGSRLGERMGSIILLATAKGEQGKGIGTALVARVMEHFREHAFTFVSVGTDLDNIPALKLYEREGFRLALAWGTYRFYRDEYTSADERDDAVTLVPLDDPSALLEKADLVRTHSFFFDARIPLEAAQKKHREYILNETNAKTLNAYEARYNGKAVGMITLREDAWLSEAGKMRVARIEDAAFLPPFAENDRIIRATLRNARDVLPSDMVEMWLPFKRRNEINALMRSGFLFAHAACVLHVWLSKRNAR